MPRAFCIPGILFLLIAFALGLLVSISLPYLPALDITRTQFGTVVLDAAEHQMTELRFGIWSPCYYSPDGARTCFNPGHAYSFSISNQAKTANVIIGASWTRGLAIHPVATIATVFALLMSFSQHITVMLFASLASFFAAALTLIAFACDIALYAYLKHQVGKLPGVQAKTTTRAGFWMTFTTLILLLLAGCTVCFGRRKDRMGGSTSYPAYSTPKKSIWARFRRK